jgi:hypothetical protein
MNKTIPILRIFDYGKAIEFYVNWLGFNIDWEHKYENDLPVYLQVSKEGIVLHLTEHHGDCSPGARVYIEYKGLKEYHTELIGKKYKYGRPGLEGAFWKDKCMEVIDPFFNKLTFNEIK